MGGIGTAVTVGLAACGWPAGFAARVLLTRIRRGVAVRGPWCELSTTLLWLLLGFRVVACDMPWWWLPLPMVIAWLGVPLVVVDVLRRRLPNVLTLAAYPLLAAVLAGACAFGPGLGLGLRACAGSVVLGGVHVLARSVAPGQLGVGDVKLAGSLGAPLAAVGWSSVAVACLVAALVTATLGLAARAVPCAAAWRGGIPHGPGLLVGAWLMVAFPASALLSAS